MNSVECAVSADRESEVSKQISDIDSAINFLHENISRLTDQLNPITRPKEQPAEKTLAAPMPPLVPLAENLFIKKNSLAEANELLISLIDRIEL